MNGPVIALIVILAVILVLVVWFVTTYNSLVQLRNRVTNGWAQVDVLLKKRADLIPNIVETVKGYAGHENAVLTQVTQARANAVSAASQPNASLATRINAENQLSRAMFDLRAVVEAYPDLKANVNFMDLQRQLAQIEEQIAYGRQFYNDVVLKYNNKIQTIPSNIVAGMCHFVEAAYFNVDDADRQVPQVNFAQPQQPPTAQPGMPMPSPAPTQPTQPGMPAQPQPTMPTQPVQQPPANNGYPQYPTADGSQTGGYPQY